MLAYIFWHRPFPHIDRKKLTFVAAM